MIIKTKSRPRKTINKKRFARETEFENFIHRESSRFEYEKLEQRNRKRGQNRKRRQKQKQERGKRRKN